MSRLECTPVSEFSPGGGRIQITSPFGPRWGSLHGGTDIGSTTGANHNWDTVAVVSGTIVNQLWNTRKPSEGMNLWLLGDNGSRHKYFHLAAFKSKMGQKVKAGQPIAVMGNTGTDAIHLHIEEHQGSWANPINNTPDINEAIASRRFPETLNKPSLPNAPFPTPIENGDLVGQLFRLSDGSIEYVFVTAQAGPDQTPQKFTGGLVRYHVSAPGDVSLISPGPVLTATPEQQKRILSLPLIFQAV